ncbi:MAG: hypothetical protein COB66_05840 [Coxiella sp. (in: Bacteria)]|nr:MAG: hypothetical protein COB66_05840 [Coxiella sp. (in: g-proteobacteria)]
MRRSHVLLDVLSDKPKYPDNDMCYTEQIPTVTTEAREFLALAARYGVMDAAVAQQMVTGNYLKIQLVFPKKKGQVLMTVDTLFRYMSKHLNEHHSKYYIKQVRRWLEEQQLTKMSHCLFDNLDMLMITIVALHTLYLLNSLSYHGAAKYEQYNRFCEFFQVVLNHQTDEKSTFFRAIETPRQKTFLRLFLIFAELTVESRSTMGLWLKGSVNADQVRHVQISGYQREQCKRLPSVFTYSDDTMMNAKKALIDSLLRTLYDTLATKCRDTNSTGVKDILDYLGGVTKSVYDFDDFKYIIEVAKHRLAQKMSLFKLGPLMRGRHSGVQALYKKLADWSATRNNDGVREILWEQAQLVKMAELISTFVSDPANRFTFAADRAYKIKYAKSLAPMVG